MILAILWGVPCRAQFTLPGVEEFDVTAADITVAVGQSFSLPIMIETDDPVTWLGLFVNNDPSQCEPTIFEPGAGVLGYEAQHGSVPCDVGISPDHVFISMGGFFPPYDSDVYGSELIVLEYQITAAEPGTTTVEILDAYTMLPAATVTVTIVDEASRFVRGDLDGDSSCTVADVINLLQLTFVAGETTDCWDSADVDDNGSIDIADTVRLLQELFGEPSTLMEPCNLDETSDTLPECERTDCT